MADQAQGLRVLADRARRTNELEDSAVVTSRKTARTIAVTSGKGGVGKSNFTASLALMLAQSGESVILLDADLGLANLHVLFGLSPRFRMEHVMRGEKSLAEVLYPAADGVRLIAGGSGITELANLGEAQRKQFIEGLSELDSLADVILIDTGAGLSHNVLAFVLAAEEVIVITTPEPTAIADAYATIKVVTRENSEARIRLVVNMAASDEEARATAERLRLVAKKFLQVDLEVLGAIPFDASVPRAVRAQSPVVLENPGAPIAKAVQQIVSLLGYRTARPAGISGFLNRVTSYFGNR
jgi:flagellar biosynthesis protein FlhG